MNFRLLKANEIECRVGTQKKDNSGCSLLLYKDARVDMSLLDETVGSLNWQREHNFKDGKLYCTVSIYDTEKKCWVCKEDVGTESNTEAEKGQASDAFKRACFNVGIGRELYTAPFIWVNLKAEDVSNNKIITKFSVKEIEYNQNREISKLIIVDSKDNVRYEFGCKGQNKPNKSVPKTSKVEIKQEEENEPVSPILTREEIGIIRNNPILAEYKDEICGIHKFSDYGEEDKKVLTKMLRDKMKEILQ